MLELVIARTALNMMGFQAEIAHGVRASSWGVTVSAVITDAEPRLVDFHPELSRLGVQSRHLMDRVQGEPFGFDCPLFADELVGREAFECLQSSPEVVGADEVGEVDFATGSWSS